jgi:hypothetical protein
MVLLSQLVRAISRILTQAPSVREQVTHANAFRSQTLPNATYLLSYALAGDLLHSYQAPAVR